MGNQTWDNTLDPFIPSRGTAKNTFTTLQEVAGTVATPGTLPTVYANELKLGTKIELEAWGEYSSTGTPTLQLGFLFNAVAGAAGGTTIALTAALATSTAAAFPWHLHWGGLITGIGLAGANSTLYGSGILDFGTSLTAITANPLPVTAAARSVSIDTTIKALFGVGAVWSVSNVANQVIVDNFVAKIQNQNKTS